jgi:hypothetical protein
VLVPVGEMASLRVIATEKGEERLVGESRARWAIQRSLLVRSMSVQWSGGHCTGLGWNGGCR